MSKFLTLLGIISKYASFTIAMEEIQIVDKTQGTSFHCYNLLWQKQLFPHRLVSFSSAYFTPREQLHKYYKMNTFNVNTKSVFLMLEKSCQYQRL